MVETTKPAVALKAVTWSGQYSVGVASIDAEHQKLIGLLNDLHAAMMTGQGEPSWEGLDGLSAYTMTHFAHEEGLMRLHSYPAYLPHKAEHDKLIKQVKSLERGVPRGQFDHLAGGDDLPQRLAGQSHRRGG